MKLVIAGGTGFLGRLLIQSRPSSDEIIVLTRKPENKHSKIKNLPDNVSLVTWNFSEDESWKQSLENADSVINLVGASLASGIRWTSGVKKKLLESRTKPTKALVEAISSIDNKPKQFIQISGINYYNHTFEPIDESSSQCDSFLGKLCTEWESGALLLNEQGIKVHTIRLAPVLAKKSLLMKLLLLPYRLFAGGRYGLKGDQYFSWLHKDDFAGYLTFAIDKQLDGVVNLSAPNPIQNKVMNRIIGRVMWRPYFFHVPSLVLKIVLGEKSHLLIKSTNVISSRIPELGYNFKYTDFKTAFKEM